MKIYVASAFEDAELARLAAGVFKSYGHEITCEWWDLEYNLTRGAGMTKRQQQEQRRQLAEIEMQAVRDCDVLVKIGEGGKGAATEVGCAIGLGKTVFMVVEGAKWLRGEPNDISVFWFHPQVACHPVRVVEPLSVRAVSGLLAARLCQEALTRG